MIVRKRERRLGWLLRLIGLWFASVLAIVYAAPWQSSAQSTEDPWTKPQNLSHSGSATNPAIIIDSQAGVHVVWQDEFANYVYTRIDGDQWRIPQRTGLHALFGLPSRAENDQSNAPLYSGQNPLFIAGPGQYIFAFWIDPQDALYMTRVARNDFMNVDAWSEAYLISATAASFDVDVDARGELHLAFLRTFDDSVNPAGVYYISTKGNGEDWGVPELLYESHYLRGLVSTEANLRLAVAGTAAAPVVYIAWDNRPRKQVLLMKSVDGGGTWDQPILVAGPSPDSGSAGPFNIRVDAKDESALLIWQSGQPGGACVQYYQFSENRGETWSEAQPMMGQQTGCAQVNEFVADYSDGPQDLYYLLTNIQNQIFLSAWSGTEWSEPEAQQGLTGFEDPETFTQVLFGCQKAALFRERLYIVGCDQAGGGDIWVTYRELPPTSFWFSPPVWSQPAPVTMENLDITAIELVSTKDSMIHACFSQRQDSYLYCSRWDGATWSRITPALQLPEGETGRPSLAAGSNNELFLITGNSQGSLYFSRAKSSEAMTASNWSTPTRLPIAHDGLVSSADVVVDAAGTVYVAYSVPVNEERGVYLVQSKDKGKTWSSPLRIFNEVKAETDFIGSPSMLVDMNGFVHIIWENQSIQVDGELQPRSLYYARSEDGGLTFSDAELVVEAPVTWREILIDGEGNLHRLWQQDMMPTVLDQVSMDGGRSWQVTLLSTGGGTSAIAVDANDRLHLLSGSPSLLLHRFWEGGHWQAEVPFRWSLDFQDENLTGLMAATINSDGQMIVVQSVQTGEAGEQQLLYATRNLDLSSVPSTIRQSPDESPLPTELPIESIQERPVEPAAAVNSESASNPVPIVRNNNNDPLALLTGALLPVVLLLLSVLGIVVMRTARARVR